jgi:opacity protein-like surface antigen
MLNKYLLGIIIINLFLFSFPIQAQEILQKDSTRFRIGVEFGGGYGFKLKSNNIIEGNYSRSGINWGMRLKWGSGNIFGAGLETGWISISSLSSEKVSTLLGKTNIEASLNAIPLLFVVGAQYAGFRIHGGAGYYNVISRATVFESTIESNEWDYGYTLSLGYTFPINQKLKFGTEVRWNNISEVQISVLSLQASLLVKLWEW